MFVSRCKLYDSATACPSRWTSVWVCEWVCKPVNDYVSFNPCVNMWKCTLACECQYDYVNEPWFLLWRCDRMNVRMSVWVCECLSVFVNSYMSPWMSVWVCECLYEYANACVSLCESVQTCVSLLVLKIFNSPLIWRVTTTRVTHGRQINKQKWFNWVKSFTDERSLKYGDLTTIKMNSKIYPTWPTLATEGCSVREADNRCLIFGNDCEFTLI